SDLDEEFPILHAAAPLRIGKTLLAADNPALLGPYLEVEQEIDLGNRAVLLVAEANRLGIDDQRFRTPERAGVAQFVDAEARRIGGAEARRPAENRDLS